VADFATSKRIGSDDTNGDICIIFSSEFYLERGFTIGFSKKEVAVVETVSLSFSSRLP
jgi:hypothetical protein